MGSWSKPSGGFSCGQFFVLLTLNKEGLRHQAKRASPFSQTLCLRMERSGVVCGPLPGPDGYHRRPEERREDTSLHERGLANR
jgi:hypothetical protein